MVMYARDRIQISKPTVSPQTINGWKYNEFDKIRKQCNVILILQTQP